jgi:hypothetical protein
MKVKFNFNITIKNNSFLKWKEYNIENIDNIIMPFGWYLYEILEKEEIQEEIYFNNMIKKDIIEYAKQKWIELNDKMTKKEMINLITN